MTEPFDIRDPGTYPRDERGRTDYKKLPIALKSGRNRFCNPDGTVPEELTARLCAWIADGNSIADFCRIPENPSRFTITTWRQQDSAFDARVKVAEQIRFDDLAEQALLTALNPGTTETVIVEHGYGKRPDRKKTITEKDVQGGKLKVDTITRMLANWDPKRYGPKAHIEHSGNIDLADKMRAAQERLESRASLTSQALTQALQSSEDVARELLQLPPGDGSGTPAE